MVFSKGPGGKEGEVLRVEKRAISKNRLVQASGPEERMLSARY
jgi:hypothetical protein